MTPLEFLAVVLPPPGHGLYCAATLSPTKKQHVFVTDIEGLQDSFNEWTILKRDTYFALATFEEAGSRTADNARFIRALFLDLDGYESKRAAGQALDAFMTATGMNMLGTPWIVSSGGGLHVYWPFDVPEPVFNWKATAEKFKRLCKQEELAIDMTVTADAARVLRVPGTYNFKPKYPEPQPVTLLVEGDTFSFAELNSIITRRLAPENVPSMPPPPLPGKRPTRAPDASTVKLMENSATRFETIWMRSVGKTDGCLQLDQYAANAEEDGQEPIWRGILSWVKVCEDAQTQAPAVSSLHPYPEDRMRQKLAEIKGPYPCVKMDSENPGVCQNCVHWGKITNPLALGREVRTETGEKVITVGSPHAPAVLPPADSVNFENADEDDIPDDIPLAQYVRPAAPRGFSYGINGGVYVVKAAMDAQGNESKQEVQILPYELFVVDMLHQEGEYMVHMVALRPEGPLNVSMPSKCVVSRDETVKFLAAHNIIASYGHGNDKNLFDYVRASVEQASLDKRAVDVPQQFGWQKDGSFVYNYRVFLPGGKELTVPMPGLENVNKRTSASGTLEGWRKYWQMMVSRKLFTMLAMCLDSFGCPLMQFTDYEGFVWHIGSTESGTGKTLTLAAKAGVWGHPVHYRTGKGTSPVAMQQRAGLLNNLPLLSDEITSKARADLEWAPGFIFDITEGQGKERMESGANKERVNNSTWKLTCTLTSNTHLTDYMSGARKHSSNGEMLRMLEWTPTHVLEWEEHEKEALQALRVNYGVAGEAWVRWLVDNPETVRELLSRVGKRLRTDFEFTDDERYWQAGCTTIVSAAILLGPKYANIIELPVVPVAEALKDLVQKARRTIKKNQRTAEDILNAYTRDSFGGFIVVRAADGPNKSFRAEWGDGSTLDRSITRSRVLGRVEHGTLSEGYVEYFIEEQLLKQHCVSMSFGYSDFKAQMEAAYKVRYVKKNMMSGTPGPGMRVNVIHISRRASDDEELLPVAETAAG